MHESSLPLQKASTLFAEPSVADLGPACAPRRQESRVTDAADDVRKSMRHVQGIHPLTCPEARDPRFGASYHEAYVLKRVEGPEAGPVLRYWRMKESGVFCSFFADKDVQTEDEDMAHPAEYWNQALAEAENLDGQSSDNESDDSNVPLDRETLEGRFKAAHHGTSLIKERVDHMLANTKSRNKQIAMLRYMVIRAEEYLACVMNREAITTKKLQERVKILTNRLQDLGEDIEDSFQEVVTVKRSEYEQLQRDLQAAQERAEVLENENETLIYSHHQVAIKIHSWASSLIAYQEKKLASLSHLATMCENLGKGAVTSPINALASFLPGMSSFVDLACKELGSGGLLAMRHDLPEPAERALKNRGVEDDRQHDLRERMEVLQEDRENLDYKLSGAVAALRDAVKAVGNVWVPRDEAMTTLLVKATDGLREILLSTRAGDPPSWEEYAAALEQGQEQSTMPGSRRESIMSPKPSVQALDRRQAVAAVLSRRTDQDATLVGALGAANGDRRGKVLLEWVRYFVAAKQWLTTVFIPMGLERTRTLSHAISRKSIVRQASKASRLSLPGTRKSSLAVTIEEVDPHQETMSTVNISPRVSFHSAEPSKGTSDELQSQRQSPQVEGSEEEVELNDDNSDPLEQTAETDPEAPGWFVPLIETEDAAVQTDPEESPPSTPAPTPPGSPRESIPSPTAEEIHLSTMQGMLAEAIEEKDFDKAKYLKWEIAKYEDRLEAAEKPEDGEKKPLVEDAITTLSRVRDSLQGIFVRRGYKGALQHAVDAVTELNLYAIPGDTRWEAPEEAGLEEFCKKKFDLLSRKAATAVRRKHLMGRHGWLRAREAATRRTLCRVLELQDNDTYDMMHVVKFLGERPKDDFERIKWWYRTSTVLMLFYRIISLQRERCKVASELGRLLHEQRTTAFESIGSIVEEGIAGAKLCGSKTAEYRWKMLDVALRLTKQDIALHKERHELIDYSNDFSDASMALVSRSMGLVRKCRRDQLLDEHNRRMVLSRSQAALDLALSMSFVKKDDAQVQTEGLSRTIFVESAPQELPFEPAGSNKPSSPSTRWSSSKGQSKRHPHPPDGPQTSPQSSGGRPPKRRVKRVTRLDETFGTSLGASFGMSTASLEHGSDVPDDLTLGGSNPPLLLSHPSLSKSLSPPEASDDSWFCSKCRPIADKRRAVVREERRFSWLPNTDLFKREAWEPIPCNTKGCAYHLQWLQHLRLKEYNYDGHLDREVSKTLAVAVSPRRAADGTPRLPLL
eukprot:Sspe_Gene.46987::Locus_23673_Transcript_1_3_Confidence_0.400_Length_4176::g.46987::m.46987